MLRRLALTAVLLCPTAAWTAETFCTGQKLPEEVADRPFTKPMTYVVAKVDNKTVLQATGEITRGESGRLAAALQKAGAVDEVWLHSPGGSALEGPRMGRVIRKAGLMTRLRAGKACISACSTAFLGGLLRVAEPGSYYGIHMMTATRDTKMMVSLMAELEQLSKLRRAALKRKIEPEEVDEMVTNAAGRYVRGLEQLAATIAAAQARYLVEMSISLDFMTEEFGQSAQGVCYLGDAGMRRFNVTNAGAVLPGVARPPPATPPATPPAETP